MIERVIGASPLGNCRPTQSPKRLRRRFALFELKKVQPRSLRDGFGAAAHAQFAVNTADLGLYRIGGDNQFLGHLGVRPSGDELPQDSLLLPTERLNGPSLDGILWCR